MPKGVSDSWAKNKSERKPVSQVDYQSIIAGESASYGGEFSESTKLAFGDIRHDRI